MMSADMVMEEVMVALSTGRCPRCNEVLLFTFVDQDTEMSCVRCGFRAGLGGDFLR